jgi:cation diffusion facilitator CzcD-associated flavoprotein CzcO
VLERGEVGDTWATQRWDRFRLNTPAWMNRLLGELPDGAFPGRDEVVARLQGSLLACRCRRTARCSRSAGRGTASPSGRPTASTSPKRWWSPAAG